MHNLGQMYRDGRGLAQDEAEAARFFRQAANLGIAQAMTSLGIMYVEGRGGLAQDEVEAVRLYRQAANLGRAEAMFNLGVMYANGRGGLARDPGEARRLFTQAAASDDPELASRARAALAQMDALGLQ